MSLKTLMASAAVALALPVAANAAMFEDCTGFTLSTTGDGDVNVTSPSASDCSFTLTGNNDGSSGLTLFTAIADVGYLLDFNWNYSTADVSPSWDPAGYTVNGALMQLSDNGGSTFSQSGSESYQISAGDEFGWYVDSVDGIVGAADLDVFSNFTVIPLPAGGLLLLTALGGMAAVRRRRKAT